MADQYVAEGVPFLRSLNVRPFEIDLGDVKYISRDFHDRLRKSALRPGDVVIVRTGKPGTCAVVSDALPEANCSDVVIVRCGEELNPHFLSYWVNAMAASHVTAHTVGAVQQHFNVASAKLLRLPVPPLSVQDEVLAPLLAIDRRIDLLRQTNATLEAIAQALFKSWFIDFDPVRAKAEGREPEGMDAATAALFPSEFEESALGEIPKGWGVRSLDSFANYLNGLAMQKFPPESDEEYLPVIKIAQLRAGNTSGADRASSRLKPDYIVRDGDVLFSWSGSLEVELWCGGNGALNQHLFKVTSSKVPKWFYYLATKQFLPTFREIAAHKATTMGHIQRVHLMEASVAMPAPEVLDALSPLMRSILERRVIGALHARELAAVRDALLPRLISGKLRLPEAEEAFATS
ncbi:MULTISPECIES: restriction endonuclease subunit S [Thiomonas]|nr:MULTISPECIES: restriction endonuclease subunit S [Thiomonas]